MQQSKDQNSQDLNNLYDNLTIKEKIIFLSGVFDGEGSFGMWSNGKGRGRDLCLGVETTDKDMVKRFFDQFGGTFYKRKARDPLRHKPTYQWRLKGASAFTTIKAMIPYMCKRRREKFYGLVKPTGYGCEDWSSYIQKQTRVKEAHVGRTKTARPKNGSR